MVVIPNAFPKLQIVKNLVRPLSKKRIFRTSFDSHRVKGSQTLVKSAQEHFYQIFSSLWRKMILKISPLLEFEIRGVFVKTLAADWKYPLPDCENLPFPIQMELSYKRKTFSDFFSSIYGIWSKFYSFFEKETSS